MTLPPARLVLPAIRWQDATGFGHALDDARAAVDAGVAGFIVFGGPAPEVAALTGELRERAGRPLLFASDLERGAGQQFDGLTELPPPGALAQLGSLDDIRRAGFLTGVEARSVGISLVLAPVADLDVEPANPIVQSRSFGADPAAVGRAVAAWVDGCQAAGAWACVKHFPGHGRTTVDSHVELPVVTQDQDTLETENLPFRTAIDAGVAAVMTAHVRYPALDPANPATCSPAIVDRLRSAFGFDGVVVTDALIMAGAPGAGDGGAAAGAAAVDAVTAGVDALLYPQDWRAVADTLQVALQEGRLPPRRFAHAASRLERLAAAPPPEVAAEPEAQAWAAALADRILALGLIGEGSPQLRRPLSVTLVDDDQGGPFPPVPTDRIVAAFDGPSGLAGPGSQVAVVLSEPRGWKGRARLSEASLEAARAAARNADLVILFGHPRLAAEFMGPEDPPVLVAWHRQRLMQDAVVRWLEAHST